MEFLLSIALIFCVFILPGKIAEHKACNYMNSHVGRVDIGKMNTDRIVNNLSNYQVNQNLINGKYDKHTKK